MKFRSRIPAAFIGVAVMILGACSGDNGKAADSSTTTPTASKDSMAGMPGMAGMGGSGMMDSMETHMKTMTTGTAEQMKAMVPAHRQKVANMISQMNQEMKSMNMPANAAWTATMDSVRQDLIHLPDLSARDLAATMPAHHARITRLLQMHKDMMAKMKS